jgi:thioredoxin 1
MRTLIACFLLLIGPTVVVCGLRYDQLRMNLAPTPEELARMPRKEGEVLFFNANWCGPCRRMKPVVAQLCREGYRIRDLDVDQNRALAQQYRIRGIPAFVFLEDGEEVNRETGGMSIDTLRNLSTAAHRN